MFMPPPTGTELSDEEAGQLDDVFFGADPFGYFTARIAGLLDVAERSSDEVDELASSEATASDPRPALPAESARFDTVVGPAAAAYRRPTADAVRLQVALDAFAVRHHAAETLLRLTYVVLRRSVGKGGPSFWADVESTPTPMSEVMAGIADAFGDADDRWNKFAEIVIAPDRLGGVSDEAAISGTATFVAWWNFAQSLFAGPASAMATIAHNKFKHGLGVRPRDDYLVTFTQTPPDADGNLPLSALQGDNAANLFDRTVLQYLSRPPGKPKSGLESTTLALDPIVLLAQAAMIAHTYAAMFAVAAHVHKSSRVQDEALVPLTAARYPGLLLSGPLPQHLVHPHAVKGMRSPLTNRPNGSDPRPAAVIFEDGTIQTLRVTGTATSGRIVDG